MWTRITVFGRDTARREKARLLRWGPWIGLLWVGWYLRLHQLGQDSLWIDEVFTWRYASYSLAEMPAALYRQAQPILAMLPFHFMLCVGDGEFLLRFPAACFGLVAVPTIYIAVRRTWGWPEGALAASMATVSSFMIRYSQEARAYSLFLLLSAASIACLWRACREKQYWPWVGLALCLGLALYTHYFALFVVGGVLSTATLCAGRAWQMEWRKGRRWPPPRHARALALTVTVLVVTYLPWLPVMRVNFVERQLAKESAAAGIRVTVAAVVSQFAYLGAGVGWHSYVVLVMALVGLAALVWNKRWPALLLSLLLCGLPWIVFATIMPRRLEPRYVVFMLPVYYGLAAAGAVDAGEAATRLVANDRRRWSLAVASLLIAVAFIVPGTQALPSYYREQKMDLRGVARFLSANVGSDHAIVAPGYRALLAYEPGLEDQYFNAMSIDELRTAYREHPRVWIVQGWPWAVNIDPDGSMSDWVDGLPAVTFEFHAARVAYAGSGIPLDRLASEAGMFVQPEGVPMSLRE